MKVEDVPKTIENRILGAPYQDIDEKIKELKEKGRAEAGKCIEKSGGKKCVGVSWKDVEQHGKRSEYKMR